MNFFFKAGHFVFFNQDGFSRHGPGWGRENNLILGAEILPYQIHPGRYGALGLFVKKFPPGSKIGRYIAAPNPPSKK